MSISLPFAGMNLCSPTIGSEIRQHVWKIPVHAQSLRADMDLVMVRDKRETTTSTGKFLHVK